MRRTWLMLAGLLRCGWQAAATSSPPELAITVTGPPVTVVDRRTPLCNATPDAPARAWRDVAGSVHLLTADPRNRTLVGPHLHRFTPSCAPIFQGKGDPDPLASDDLAWIGATWTDDGTVVRALAHVEYQGHRHPGQCPLASYRACWRNAIVDLRSADGGNTFGQEAPRSAVAALPNAYETTLGRPSGYFSPSNIVDLPDGRLAAFVFAEAAGRQPRGACLLVADAAPDRLLWRPVGGVGDDPLSSDASPGWPCPTVAGLDATMTSLVRRRASGSWIALMAGRHAASPGAEPLVGIWYVTSPDLLHWSSRRLLLELPVMFAFACDHAEAEACPSLLDPDAPGRNFDTVGDTADLWLVRFAIEPGCRLSRARDLLRPPVRIRKGPDAVAGASAPAP
jgi:hypothetical protein